jgi:DNA-binding NtrC family response regulator
MKVIIAEDDKYYSNYIKYSIKLAGDHEIICCSSSVLLFKTVTENTDLVFLDYHLEDTDGLINFSKLKSKYPKTEIITISGQQDIDVAVKLLNKGAFEYIVKNEEAKNRIVHATQRLSKQKELESTIINLEGALSSKYNLKSVLISRDKSFEPIYKLIDKAARSNINVSIYGQTGTGKELVAKSIHYNSERKNEPFIAVNLSALSENLIESELFGFEKGSFTGANERRIGRFEEAKEGTLFLDEISEVPLHIQVKLLRVLQEREISRIGSNKTIPIKCRIICASNKDLKKEVEASNFREDLYYRLIGLPITLHELRYRGNDILHLTRHFLDIYSKENKTERFSITQAASDKLEKYHFPGNVRELKSIIELACVLSDDNIIQEENIQIRESKVEMNILESEYTLKQINDNIIRSMLARYNNNVRLVADKLGIGKSTIYRLIQENDSNNLSA